MRGSHTSTCGSCRWFDQDNPTDEDNRGRCRRRAPALSINGHGLWLGVNGDDWCGDYEQYPRRVELVPDEIPF